jgi:carbon monoxide dehydrogenase subunit G
MTPITQQVQINADKSAVWQAITDIEHCEQMIEGIVKVEVLNKST